MRAVRLQAGTCCQSSLRPTDHIKILLYLPGAGRAPLQGSQQERAGGLDTQQMNRVRDSCRLPVATDQMAFPAQHFPTAGIFTGYRDKNAACQTEFIGSSQQIHDIDNTGLTQYSPAICRYQQVCNFARAGNGGVKSRHIDSQP